MDIQTAINQLYSTFSKYSPSDMYYCDCGCIDVEDVKKLASKPLKVLEEDDFVSYHGSALYTWGGLDHYKFFLPRILEVHHQKNGYGLIGLFEITSKLEYAKWETWDSKEVDAIIAFIKSDWNRFVHERKSEIYITDLRYYSFFIPPDELLNVWDVTKSKNSMHNFVRFFYNFGSELMHTGLDKKDTLFIKKFRTFITQKVDVALLEEEFFRVDDLDKEYSTEISIILQMIEQEKRIAPSELK
ncbi:MAG: hypothetical protein P1U56_24880 [Saprospiraceae bacterium]|nr:hypothetical protein [Saprospiraceae bacterium]